MRVLNLALKDLSQVLRDKMSLLFLVAMPILFTFFMGLAFKGVVSVPDPRLPVGWANDDPDGLLSQALYDVLAASDVIRLVEVDPAEVDRSGGQIESGDLAGVLVVPRGFSALVQAGQPPQLTLIADEFSTTGQSVFQSIRAAVTRLMSAAEIARMDVEAIKAREPFAAPPDRDREWVEAFSLAMRGWQESAEWGPQIAVERREAETEPQQPLGGNPYNQTSPGILLQFAIAGLMGSANILVQERKTHTLQRLRTTAIRPWEIIAGHLLSTFAVSLAQQALLIAFGQWVLGVDYMRQPAGTLLVATTLGLWVASMGLLIGVLARGEEQVILFSLIAMFLFTALGGAWFPLEGTGAAFSTLGHLTPGAWAMDGFQNVLIRGLGLASTLRPAGILLAYAAAFFAAAVWRFRFE